MFQTGYKGTGRWTPCHLLAEAALSPYISTQPYIQGSQAASKALMQMPSVGVLRTISAQGWWCHQNTCYMFQTFLTGLPKQESTHIFPHAEFSP